jgi:hypothetical protein
VAITESQKVPEYYRSVTIASLADPRSCLYEAYARIALAAETVELRVPPVDGHVFSAALENVRGQTGAPGKAPNGAAPGDPYLEALAMRPKRGFSLPMGPWLTGPLAPLVAAASEPDAPVWSLVDRARAAQAGLASPQPRRRWAETWALTALNAWLETWAGNLA